MAGDRSDERMRELMHLNKMGSLNAKRPWWVGHENRGAPPPVIQPGVPTPGNDNSGMLEGQDLGALLASATRPDNAGPAPGLPGNLEYVPQNWWQGGGPPPPPPPPARPLSEMLPWAAPGSPMPPPQQRGFPLEGRSRMGKVPGMDPNAGYLGRPPQQGLPGMGSTPRQVPGPPRPIDPETLKRVRRMLDEQQRKDDYMHGRAV